MALYMFLTSLQIQKDTQSMLNNVYSMISATQIEAVFSNLPLCCI